LEDVTSIILAGGKGTRLKPLTDELAKPAVSFAGSCKLIDIPILASLEAHIPHILILTQYKSESIEHHVRGAYPICPQIQTLSAKELGCAFEGTADAIRQIRNKLANSSSEYFLILSGDQIHDFDIPAFVAFAKKNQADCAIASVPVSRADAPRLGILQMDLNGKITQFVEKPKSKKKLDTLTSPSPDMLDKPYLGSMGIYLFRKKALLSLLEKDLREDFGKHLIPTQIKRSPTYCYVHKGEWEDIGTIATFYKANLDLVKKAGKCLIDKTAIAEGSLVTHSILGEKANLKPGSNISHSIIVGSNVTIGNNCTVKKTIIDKNAFIGHGVILTNSGNLEHYDDIGQGICIRDGIIIVKKGARLPDGFRL